MVNPPKTIATALPALSGPASFAAVLEATARNRPCPIPATKRAIIMRVKLLAKAVTRLPKVKIMVVTNMVFLRDQPLVSAVNTGAANVAPKA
ncbi:hypothetical protein D3C75_1018310 [compost metagenome]